MCCLRCVAKRKCFAPAALYKPFGEQAAGVRSLSQFQALQDGESELASLRELGLTDLEVELWLNRDQPENTEKVNVIYIYISFILYNKGRYSCWTPTSCILLGKAGNNIEEKVIVAFQCAKLVEMTSVQPDCNNVILTSFAHW
jgi:hypothetical protein